MRDEKEQYYWDLIAAKVSGNISPDEEFVLSRWINNSEANRKKYEEAVELWKTSQRQPPLAENTVDINNEWLAFQQRVANHHPGKKKTIPYWSIPAVRLAIAASLSAIVVTLFIVWQSESDSWITYQATNEVLTITLPDNSKVWLNQYSTLRVKEDFSKRQVHLNGEGYFQVKRNEDSPFVVETKQGLVTVLGTSFNVKSTDTSSVVSVLSGRVGVESSQHQTQELAAWEQAMVDERSVKKSKMPANSFYDWRLLNNSLYAEELANGLSLLSVNYTWKKNAINSSVLEGFIVNNALLTKYTTIFLEVDYKRPTGKVVKTNLLIEEVLEPGDSLNFTKRLLDIFSRTEDITVKVVSASVKK